MQDQTKDQPDDAENAEFNATLIRGRIYVFKGIRFARGVPVPVSREVKERLENKAFDQVTIDNGDGRPETEKRAKFKFERIGAEKTPRARQTA